MNIGKGRVHWQGSARLFLNMMMEKTTDCRIYFQQKTFFAWMFKSFETSFLLVFDLTSLENAFTCHHALGGSHGLRTPNKSKISEKFGRCGRQNVLRPYLKIWDWDWTFGRAVKAISSLGVRSPCLLQKYFCSIFGSYENFKICFRD